MLNKKHLMLCAAISAMSVCVPMLNAKKDPSNAFSDYPISLEIAKETYKNEPWKYVENAFVYGMDAQTNALLAKSLKIGVPAITSLVVGLAAAAGGLVLGGKIAHKIEPYGHGKIPEIVAGVTCVGGLGITGLAVGAAAGVVAYKLCKCAIEAYVSEKIVSEIATNWEKLKGVMPQEFHSTFDALSNPENLKQMTYTKALEITRSIRKLVYEKNPEKYAEQLKNDTEVEEKTSEVFIKNFSPEFIRNFAITAGVVGGVAIIGLTGAALLKANGEY